MSFKETAKKATSGSFITEGREKIDMEDVIRLYGKIGVTITGCDMLKDKKGNPFGAFTFKEDETKFFFGGQVLNEIAKEWANLPFELRRKAGHCSRGTAGPIDLI